MDRTIPHNLNETLCVHIYAVASVRGTHVPDVVYHCDGVAKSGQGCSPGHLRHRP